MSNAVFFGIIIFWTLLVIFIMGIGLLIINRNRCIGRMQRIIEEMSSFGVRNPVLIVSFFASIVIIMIAIYLYSIFNEPGYY